MMRIFAVVLALLPTVAAAQDLQFSMRHTEACLQDALGGLERNACIGVSAEMCMDATPSGSTTYGMSGCLGYELEYWDARLNTSYQALRARKKADDAEIGGPVKQAEALRDMQRAWITYRDATCDFERSQWGGGTGGGPATGACLLRLTGEQALYLEENMVAY